MAKTFFLKFKNKYNENFLTSYCTALFERKSSRHFFKSATLTEGLKTEWSECGDWYHWSPPQIHLKAPIEDAFKTLQYLLWQQRIVGIIILRRATLKRKTTTDKRKKNKWKQITEQKILRSCKMKTIHSSLNDFWRILYFFIQVFAF